MASFRSALLFIVATNACLAYVVQPSLLPSSHLKASSACQLVMMAKKGGAKKGGAGKMVQVVLSAPIQGLGKAGELVSVKPAYADNFIINKGLGSIATPEKLKELAVAAADAAAAAAAAKQAALDADATIQAVFGQQGCFIKKNVGPDGAIFGSVTAAELAEAIRERSGVSVDKKTISIPSISSVGSVMADIQIHKEVSSKLKVVVVSASM